ncbi:hypothetical protein [Agromyces larvae]|uniref:Uncharacterized protein n=1 Tax=Agromyces larvae TaxID=2929802 RepID=A0ABY4BU24_9MICO|nr:hypothetical protein [Agromyces larvae]UOE42645.1 hypothetical protein MTO99_10605 [Agromyces larvae]
MAASAELDAFLDSVASFTPEQFATVLSEARRIGAKARSAARKAAKLSAADFSALDHRVRALLEPLHEALSAAGPGAVSSAVSDTLSAAHGIVRRTRLSSEEYLALVGPFIVAGAIAPEADQPIDE